MTGEGVEERGDRSRRKGGKHGKSDADDGRGRVLFGLVISLKLHYEIPNNN